MKKILFGIFAHPDDEAFGPSGTLLKMARAGTDIHLICATGGENGLNCDNHKSLGKIRLEEWRKSGSMIGAVSMHHLSYRDGSLSNSLFHQITDKIESHIRNKLQDYGNQELEVSFMTFDTNGISGHIDHIVMSMATSYIYYRLREEKHEHINCNELLYFCIDRQSAPQPDTGYVFMPAGRRQDDIDITTDITDVAEEKRAIMCAHHSQRQDAEMLLKREMTLKAEHFYLAR